RLSLHKTGHKFQSGRVDLGPHLRHPSSRRRSLWLTAAEPINEGLPPLRNFQNPVPYRLHLTVNPRSRHILNPGQETVDYSDGPRPSSRYGVFDPRSGSISDPRQKVVDLADNPIPSRFSNSVDPRPRRIAQPLNKAISGEIDPPDPRRGHDIDHLRPSRIFEPVEKLARNVYSPFPGCFNSLPDALNGALNPIPKIRSYVEHPLPSRLQPLANRFDDGLNLLPRSFGGTADAAPIPLPRLPKSVNSRPGESQFQEKWGESEE